ncbi:MAG: V-type ATPase 116kDa subunit family protein [Spirochaetales bacterium]|uniref:V-type ATPase 116kDa subunit family protein n=1 Tax=Candidatus Thalassospirochaeta sargassi TaxID=3119039 RepID=A0AAJ1IKF1_9SPIO|nr:V-type ATPase 116kDa subunit family protein [Spirochaetales bacterium]
MSLFTSRMKLLSAVVLESRIDAVTSELLRIGLLDFVEISKLFNTDDFSLKSGDSSLYSEISALRKKLEIIYNNAGIDTPFREELNIGDMTEYKPDYSSEIISKLNYELASIRDKQKNLHQEYLKLNEISNYFTTSGSAKDSKFLIVSKGHPTRGNFSDILKNLASIPHFGTDIPETNNFFIVSLRRDQSLLNNILDKFQWIELDEQHYGEEETNHLIDKINKKNSMLRQEIESAGKQIAEHIILKKDELDSLWKNLRLHELYSSIQNNFSHTVNTSLFSGWLPADKVLRAEEAIRNASGGECIIEWSEAENFSRENVPVEIRQPKVFSPFRMLVENYAVPEYGSIDPTPFVAVAYMIMFGLMFGDAGQGLVIMLIGILGGRIIKKAGSGVKNLFKLFIFCGGSSVAAGILFGSYFGNELFPAVWFNYHSVVSGNAEAGSSIVDVYDILKITIYFGIAVIGTGLVINWINLYRKKDYFNLFLDKSGLLGGWFYGCGVYTAFYFVGTGYKVLPDAGLLTIFFGIPVIILFFKAPLHFILHERDHKQFGIFSLVDFFMEWIVEILEIFSGYLANTLSFMRVAGLGIAHVSLMTAFDTIAAMTNGAASVIILISGNILVIALEGLSAGIQALRLNYYEFFSRYFTGKGIAYNPVSLRNRKQEG